MNPGFTERIEGLREEESDVLLRLLLMVTIALSPLWKLRRGVQREVKCQEETNEIWNNTS